MSRTPAKKVVTRSQKDGSLVETPILHATKPPRILLWDIECHNLDANYGYMICVGMKWLGAAEPVRMVSLRDYYPKTWRHGRFDPTNDERLAVEAAKLLTEADIWVTWYGERFDRRYVNTRLMRHGHAPLPPMTGTQHVDGWRLAKENLRLNSNRLAVVQDFFQLPEQVSKYLGVTPPECRHCGQAKDEYAKNRIDTEYWRKAGWGDAEAIGYIEDHCRRDVLILEQAYLKLRSLHRQPPNLTAILGLEGCPHCGAPSVDPATGKPNLMLNGRRLARTGVAQRFQCKVCTGYSHAPFQRTAEVYQR